MGYYSVFIASSSSLNAKSTFHNVSVYKRTTFGDLQYSGLEVTIPANSYFSLLAKAIWGNSKPILVVLSTKADSCNEIASGLIGYNSATCSVSGKTTEDTPMYLWAQFSNAEINNVQIQGFYIQQD